MMTLRKSWFSLALVLPIAAISAGCSQEPAVEVSPVTSVPADASPDPITHVEKEAPPATTPETPAEAPKAEAPKAEAPPAEVPKAEAPALEAPKGAATVKFTEEQLAAIKLLPADEQAVALKQAVCPVSDEPLGSMDMPVKVVAEGKTLYVCCKGCTKEVEADPKAFLAKLGLK